MQPRGEYAGIVSAHQASISRKLAPANSEFGTLLAAADTRSPDADDLGAELGSHLAASTGPWQLWIPNPSEAEDAVAQEQGFVPYRDLWQLRINLPIATPARARTVTTRSFTPADADGFLNVNNRAFAWHPEQGGMTHERLDATRAEPWHDDEHFRILEQDGKVIGFNWLKIHQDFSPAMGEIYAIAIDPDAHGGGLGLALTRNGLDHLHHHGLTRAMLYVESDNTAANAAYERAGFAHHQTNRAYRRS